MWSTTTPPRGNERGATLSFRGIDNNSYYRLTADNKRFYVNDTGTGNTMDLYHPRVLQMVMDSLRYWVKETHVDGFRFDLGTILARDPSGFDVRSGFLTACSQDPCLQSVKLIAEPWDIGPGGYQVGGFPPGWSEWNDKFRDTVRDFWRGAAPAGEMARRVQGSGDVFDNKGRRPRSSVNFVAAHDGFTLDDLVTFDEKHNEANGEDNKDGSDNNHSWNCGVEGPTDDPEINALRLRQIRNLLATLFFSQGLPMLLAGDESGRSQGGNNNAYCHDDEISWLDWDLGERGETILAFAKLVTGLRAQHPALHHGRYLGRFDFPDNPRDLTWLTPEATEMDRLGLGGRWRAGLLHADRRAGGSGRASRCGDAGLQRRPGQCQADLARLAPGRRLDPCAGHRPGNARAQGGRSDLRPGRPLGRPVRGARALSRGFVSFLQAKLKPPPPPGVFLTHTRRISHGGSEIGRA